MIVKDPGHRYLLNMLDQEDPTKTFYGELVYVKREGSGYPGNIGHHPGTTIQEVCRVQINRLLYVNRQIPSRHTENAIRSERQTIKELEERAAERHGRVLKNIREDIENEPVCSLCGHIQCEGECRK